jgi:hypothetical protein
MGVAQSWDWWILSRFSCSIIRGLSSGGPLSILSGNRYGIDFEKRPVGMSVCTLWVAPGIFRVACYIAYDSVRWSGWTTF